MLKVVSLFIGLLVFLVVNPAHSELLFYDDCENKWALQTDWLESNTTKGNNYAAVSSEQARAGSSSYKLYVQPLDINNYSATNSGLILRGLNSPIQIKNFLYDKTYWMGFSVFVPTSYNFPDPSYKFDSGSGEWQLLWQFHGIQDSCDQPNLNPPIGAFLKKEVSGYSFAIKGDDRECIARPYVRNSSYSASFSKGVWHDTVIHFRFNYKNSGFFRVWINGKQVAYDSGINAYNQSKGPYFVLGPYGNMKNGTTIYFDEIRVGDANSSFNEVSPKGVSLKVDFIEAPKLQIISGQK